MSILNSIDFIPVAVSATWKDLSKFLMVKALAAIGLNTDIKEMKKSGFQPIIHSFLIPLLAVIVAFAVEYFIEVIKKTFSQIAETVFF